MDQAELIKIIEKAARDGVKKLDLSSKGITELPEQISQLVNLQELQLISRATNPLVSPWESVYVYL